MENAIIENASVQEILTGLEKLPGASIVGEFFASFDCPKYSFAYPPIDEFFGNIYAWCLRQRKNKTVFFTAIKTTP